MKHFAKFLILGSIYLSACIFDQERVAGGEDFPNTLKPLGKITAENIGANAQWDQFQEIPAVPDAKPADSVIQIPPTIATHFPERSLKFSTPIIADTTWDFRDTAIGLVRKYSVDNISLNKVRRDTVIYRWDANFRDSIIGNELALEARGLSLTRIPYKLLPYRFLNLNAAGGFDQADYGQIQKGLDSTMRFQYYSVLAGADGDLATKEDNQIVHYQFLRKRDQDTLDFISVVDADGDNVLWGQGDSGIVAITHFYKNPVRTPQAEKLALTLKVKMLRKGDTSVPLFYREKRSLKNGTSTEFTIKGFKSDSLIELGDSALVTYHQRYPENATQVESNGRFVIQFGKRFWRFTDNQLLRFEISKQWRTGAIRSSMFQFKPDAPVPSGETEIQGNFTIELAYEDGGTGSVSGDYNAGKIKALLHEMRKGARKGFKLVFDASGSLVTSEVLPN